MRSLIFSSFFFLLFFKALCLLDCSYFISCDAEMRDLKSFKVIYFDGKCEQRHCLIPFSVNAYIKQTNSRTAAVPNC